MVSFCFTKFFRPLIKKWASQDVSVFLYIDDGLIIADTEVACQRASDIVRADLKAAGVQEAPKNVSGYLPKG